MDGITGHVDEINRIHHWCSVGTGKSQPEDSPFLWETRLAEFPTGTVDPRVGNFPVVFEHILFLTYHNRIHVGLQMTPGNVRYK